MNLVVLMGRKRTVKSSMVVAIRLEGRIVRYQDVFRDESSDSSSLLAGAGAS